MSMHTSGQFRGLRDATPAAEMRGAVDFTQADSFNLYEKGHSILKVLSVPNFMTAWASRQEIAGYENATEDEKNQQIQRRKLCNNFYKILETEFKGLDGVLVNGIAPEDLNFLLADGTGLVFELNSSNCTKDFGATSDSPLKQTCGQIYADIDGIKGANTYGKDYFVFYVTKSGVFPTGGKNSKNTNTLANLKLNCLTPGVECAGWVIENGNMDYLKCPNELD